ncbi:hypothetical protein [Dongia sp.]|uniref:hypothetical protein n=1 Tax=Dongia sp. TaxID=1977262 RepID=UPI0035AE3CE4
MIGDPESGILFVKTSPLMTTHISKATIDAYASSHNETFASVFGKIAAGAKAIINKTATSQTIPDVDTSYEAIGKMIGAGATVSDAQFCFVADINDADWKTYRSIVAPISKALGHLSPPASPEDFVQLRDAPLD